MKSAREQLDHIPEWKQELKAGSILVTPEGRIKVTCVFENGSAMLQKVPENGEKKKIAVSCTAAELSELISKASEIVEPSSLNWGERKDQAEWLK